ncbi:MAG: hypothetical protein JRG96_01800 [Deltaproteobacteria bacterium]|nr:hypothetical protein [Deltaproteobacteria bacterium]MBW2417845.1 hypothetical protein [Deltaproteobacteria bacterium]
MDQRREVLSVRPKGSEFSPKSDLACNGTDLETLRDLLGHHSVQTTKIYPHTRMERKRAVVESL